MKGEVKKGRGKLYLIIALVLIFIMASGVLAESIGLSDDVKNIINGVVEKQGINSSDIKSVEQVGFDKLPPQVDLKNIDTTNLAVYQVDYGGDKPVFVITASGETIKASPPKTFAYKMFLNFGASGEVSTPSFLTTANGVEGSLEKGYVMVRDGSITGLSTNLEVLSGEGSVEVMVYVNGQPIGFRNTIYADSTGVKKDYDTQSFGVVNFQKGDVISAYVKTDGNIAIKDVINLIEISTAD
jgi:hypothetical protein